jgi:hypothetical protein
MGENVIWQYWETRGEKPAFIDGLHEIARRNAGVKIVLVTPETLRDHLPDIEDGVFAIEDLAHKADMIRTRLVARHGGMWLDSDAVVLSDLNFLFDHLERHEFVGFNNEGRLQEKRPWVRVCCFLSRPNSAIVKRWVEAQAAKLPRTKFAWAEIGAAMLNAICLEHAASAKVLPFEQICPIGPKKVEQFLAKDEALAERIARDCFMVMLTNRALETRQIALRRMSVAEIAAGDTVISAILKKALAS